MKPCRFPPLVPVDPPGGRGFEPGDKADVDRNIQRFAALPRGMVGSISDVFGGIGGRRTGPARKGALIHGILPGSGKGSGPSTAVTPI